MRTNLPCCCNSTRRRRGKTGLPVDCVRRLITVYGVAGSLMGVRRN